MSEWLLRFRHKCFRDVVRQLALLRSDASKGIPPAPLRKTTPLPSTLGCVNLLAGSGCAKRSRTFCGCTAERSCMPSLRALVWRSLQKQKESNALQLDHTNVYDTSYVVS